jgi:predicted nucleic acid-binding protein
MSLKVYIDTNVYLNSIENRDKEVSKNVLAFLAQKDVQLYLNDLSIINIHYIAKKKRTREEITQILKIILRKQEIVSIDKHIIENSLDSEFKDFEDGVQYFCARRVDADLILTSNKKDFAYSEIEVLTPLEFYNEYME